MSTPFLITLAASPSSIPKPSKETAVIRSELLSELAARHNWSAETFEIWNRTDFHCAYCGFDLLRSLNDFKQGELDHLLPQGEYPSLVHCPWNLVLTCVTCNKLKRNWDPQSNGEPPIVSRNSLTMSEDEHRRIFARVRRHVLELRLAREEKFLTERGLILRWIAAGRP